MAKEQKATNGTAATVAEMRNGNFIIRREAIKDKRGNQYMTDDGRLFVTEGLTLTTEREYEVVS